MFAELLRLEWCKRSHIGPCCVLGHFRLSFHGQAFDDAWPFWSCSFKASLRKKKVAIVADISQASLLNPTKYYYFLSLDSKGAKVGIPRRKKPEKTPRKSRRKNCANVGSADRKRKNLVQRNVISAKNPNPKNSPDYFNKMQHSANVESLERRKNVQLL